MKYREDEVSILNAVAGRMRSDQYERSTDHHKDYLFFIPWDELLPYGLERYDRLTEALDCLRKYRLDSITRDTTTLNGHIMKAKIHRHTEVVEMMNGSVELVTAGESDGGVGFYDLVGVGEN